MDALLPHDLAALHQPNQQATGTIITHLSTTWTATTAITTPTLTTTAAVSGSTGRQMKLLLFQ